MWFKTPDGLTAYVTLIHVNEPHDEVAVTYRSPAVFGTHVYPLGSLVPLTSAPTAPLR
jgi:hypothetical protein